MTLTLGREGEQKNRAQRQKDIVRKSVHIVWGTYTLHPTADRWDTRPTCSSGPSHCNGKDCLLMTTKTGIRSIKCGLCQLYI